MSKGVQQTGNRVPRIRCFAEKGKIPVNSPDSLLSDREMLVRVSYRHLSPRGTFLRTLQSSALDMPHVQTHQFSKLLKNIGLYEASLPGTRTRR